MLHHALFIVVAAWVLAHSIFKYPFVWLALGEASTPFINLRCQPVAQLGRFLAVETEYPAEITNNFGVRPDDGPQKIWSVLGLGDPSFSPKITEYLHNFQIHFETQDLHRNDRSSQFFFVIFIFWRGK